MHSSSGKYDHAAAVADNAFSVSVDAIQYRIFSGLNAGLPQGDVSVVDALVNFAPGLEKLR